MTRPESAVDRARSAALRQRWERLHIDVRCALRADEPERIRWYLKLGHRLMALSRADAPGLQLQMLRTLLDTARDTTLPAPWRRSCLRHTNALLMPLRRHLGLLDPLTMRVIEAAIVSAAATIPACVETVRGR